MYGMPSTYDADMTRTPREWELEAEPEQPEMLLPCEITPCGPLGDCDFCAEYRRAK